MRRQKHKAQPLSGLIKENARWLKDELEGDQDHVKKITKVIIVTNKTNNIVKHAKVEDKNEGDIKSNQQQGDNFYEN